MKTKSSDVGVLVGRFQVPSLHEAHIELIDSVVNRHPKVILFLGLSPCMVTRNNPLDFEARKKMIQDKYPDITVLYIKDVPSDASWSGMLDGQISDVCRGQSVTLYGGRDGFIKHYKGIYPTVELESKTYVSGTEIRNSISKSVKQSPDFRAGVIWAAYNQYPKVYPTVDVAIFNESGDEILMGKKLHEEQFRFIGGFADPNSESYEMDARREAAEETGCEIGDIRYIGSTLVPDWRYAREQDKIKTLFFRATYVYGSPRANDDIAMIKWIKVKDLAMTPSIVIDTHQNLVQMLFKHLADQPVTGKADQQQNNKT
jgi:bifunctional NMN adenylyltransferase/nudix hydrolase